MNNTQSVELVDHLTELRARVIRCMVYIAVGATIGWFIYNPIFKIACAPLVSYLALTNSRFLLTGLAEGFMMKMQVAVIFGLIVAIIPIIFELWRFLEPGLKASESRAVKLVAPLSAFLFVFGVAASYFVLPAGVKWLTDQNPPGSVFMPSASQALLFILKMCLAFGVVFQMPVLLIILASIGLVDNEMLRKYWRHAIVGICIVAAVATPSNDAFTMIMMCIPMVFLYILSIGLVCLVTRRRNASQRQTS